MHDSMQGFRGDVIVPDSDDPESNPPEYRVALLVERRTIRVVVYCTIEFDDQPQFGAEEVDDEPLHYLLPPKMESADLPSPEDLPSCLLGGR